MPNPSVEIEQAVNSVACVTVLFVDCKCTRNSYTCEWKGKHYHDQLCQDFVDKERGKKDSLATSCNVDSFEGSCCRCCINQGQLEINKTVRRGFSNLVLRFSRELQRVSTFDRDDLRPRS